MNSISGISRSSKHCFCLLQPDKNPKHIQVDHDVGPEDVRNFNMHCRYTRTGGYNTPCGGD